MADSIRQMDGEPLVQLEWYESRRVVNVLLLLGEPRQRAIYDHHFDLTLLFIDANDSSRRIHLMSLGFT